ncbi:MAG: hypothetical protein ACRCYX_09100 [Dermatophilaceae bacterium]
MHTAPPLPDGHDPNPYGSGSMGTGPMPRRWVAVIVAALVVLTAPITVPVVWFVAFYGCRGDDYALADDLAASELLQLAPAGTEPSGAPSTSCEDDGDVPNAAQDHLRRAVGTEAVLDFYRNELPERGWTPAPGLALEEVPASSGSATCWTSAIDGRAVDLEVVEEGGPGRYSVQLSARVDGSGGWCE